MPTCVTYVTEKHFFFVRRTFDILGIGNPPGGDCHGSWGGMVRARERLRCERG